MSENVVHDLAKKYLNERRTIITDNFYTSISFCNILNEQRTHLIDTLRKNRKNLPKYVVNAVLKKSEVTERYAGPIFIIKLCFKRWEELIEKRSWNK